MSLLMFYINIGLEGVVVYMLHWDAFISFFCLDDFDSCKLEILLDNIIDCATFTILEDLPHICSMMSFAVQKGELTVQS